MKRLVLLFSLFNLFVVSCSCEGGTYCYYVQPNGDVVEFKCDGQAEVVEDDEDPVMSDGGPFFVPWQWWDFDSGVLPGDDSGLDSSTEVDAGTGTDSGNGDSGTGDNEDAGSSDSGSEVDTGTGSDPDGGDGDAGSGNDSDAGDGSDAGGDDDDDVDEDCPDDGKCKCRVKLVKVTGTHPNSGKTKEFVCPFRTCKGDCEGDPRPKGLLSVCKRLQ